MFHIFGLQKFWGLFFCVISGLPRVLSAPVLKKDNFFLAGVLTNWNIMVIFKKWKIL